MKKASSGNLLKALLYFSLGGWSLCIVNLAYSTDLQTVLEKELKIQRESSELIGIAGVVIKAAQIEALASNGLRKKGSTSALSTEDKWHLGSVTKSMTATVIARLVQQGKMGWNQKLDIIPQGTENRHKAWETVTLKHLLHHSSGAPSNFPLTLMFKDDPVTPQALARARLAAIQKVLTSKPANLAGSTFEYSNVGYTIAAVMAEQATGKSWETLMQQELFSPLALHSAGFGPPQDSGKDIEQPRGHKSILGFKFAMPSTADNPKIMGPAGNIHMSLKDLAIYANEHLKGARGNSDYLPSPLFGILHGPELNGYAKGWVIKQHDPLAQGKVIWHNGSNTMWYCLLTLLPALDTAIAITVNEGNIKKAEASATHITRAILQRMNNKAQNRSSDEQREEAS